MKRAPQLELLMIPMIEEEFDSPCACGEVVGLRAKGDQPTGQSRPTALPKLGHAKASITMDFYAHAVPENDQKAAQIIGELPQRKPKQAKIIPMPKSA